MDQEKCFHDLLARALALPTGERQAFFDGSSFEDPELLREVRQILDAEADLSELRLPTEVVEDALGDGDEVMTARAQADLQMPARVGPYRVEGRLGHGGMGEVYRGFDSRLGRPVALKRVVTGLKSSPVALERLRREAKAIARLNHPAIVQIHDWVEACDGDADRDSCWYVMELVEGRTLKQVIGGRPLPAKRVVAIGRAIAGGLAAAHAAGILHRDLKAENVMIDDRGTVKLLDFGLARSLQSHPDELTLTREGLIVGTVSCMSPEQAMGETLDERSDLFSYGILLYQAATGVSPFLGDTMAQTLANIRGATLTAAIERNPEVPRILSDLIDHLLEKDKDRRPGNMAEVLARLRRMAPVPRPGRRPPERGGAWERGDGRRDPRSGPALFRMPRAAADPVAREL